MDLKVNSSDEEIDLFIDRLYPYLERFSSDPICVLCIVLFGIEFTISRINKYSIISRDKVYQLPFSNSRDSISLTFPFSSSDNMRLLHNHMWLFFILTIY